MQKSPSYKAGHQNTSAFGRLRVLVFRFSIFMFSNIETVSSIPSLILLPYQIISLQDPEEMGDAMNLSNKPEPLISRLELPLAIAIAL